MMKYLTRSNVGTMWVFMRSRRRASLDDDMFAEDDSGSFSFSARARPAAASSLCSPA
jgi:hypothetical protein